MQCDGFNTPEAVTSALQLLGCQWLVLRCLPSAAPARASTPRGARRGKTSYSLHLSARAAPHGEEAASGRPAIHYKSVRLLLSQMAGRLLHRGWRRVRFRVQKLAQRGKQLYIHYAILGPQTYKTYIAAPHRLASPIRLRQ